MKRYFLGLAAGYSGQDIWQHTFAMGFKRDCRELKQYLRQHYGDGDNTRVILCKNGRSALCLALKAYFQPGDAIIVNGFTCYAVYEAIKAAGLVPIWVDINKGNLNFDSEKLNAIIERFESVYDNRSNRSERIAEGKRSEPLERGREQKGSKNAQLNIRPAGIIVQNSLGNPADIVAIEKLAKKHNLTIIEDLAHCVGVKYADGRTAGTVGSAAVFSFGKDKSIDTVSGGALVLRYPYKNNIQAPSKTPKPSDHLRARFYPLFGATCRGLTTVHLGGILMRGLIKIHWVERSADNKLDLERKISKFEAKLALAQFKKIKKSGEPVLRNFYLVQNRDEVLKKLQQAGYYFQGFWYERPVSPQRYYKKVHFPESTCQTATEVTQKIINFPTYYSQKQLAPALKIIQAYLPKTNSTSERKPQHD